MSPWHSTNRYRPPGKGLAVERDDGQLGYAKLDSIYYEKLGAELAHLIDVRVPCVDIDTIQGAGPFAISYVHSESSRPLAIKEDLTPRDYSSCERDALSQASGLLPFLVWIADTDHFDDTNLVIDRLGNGTCRIGAIDFEHAFDWGNEDETTVRGPPGLIANIDRPRVAKHLAAIEGLSPAAIRDCCAACCLPQFANDLDRRRGLLRDRLGWWLD